MNILKGISLLFGLSILFQLAFFEPLSEHEKIANQIISRSAKAMEKKYNISWIGEGGGMMECIKMIALSFNIYHPLEKDEARKLVVNCTEDFLNEINQNEKICPFLQNFPFEPKNIEIAIFIYDSDKRKLYDPYIAVASSERGSIIFRTNDLDNEYAYKNKIKENYEDALRIVQS